MKNNDIFATVVTVTICITLGLSLTFIGRVTNKFEMKKKEEVIDVKVDDISDINSDPIPCCDGSFPHAIGECPCQPGMVGSNNIKDSSKIEAEITPAFSYYDIRGPKDGPIPDINNPPGTEETLPWIDRVMIPYDGNDPGGVFDDSSNSSGSYTRYYGWGQANYWYENNNVPILIAPNGLSRYPSGKTLFEPVSFPNLSDDAATVLEGLEAYYNSKDANGAYTVSRSYINNNNIIRYVYGGPEGVPQSVCGICGYDIHLDLEPVCGCPMPVYYPSSYGDCSKRCHPGPSSDTAIAKNVVCPEICMACGTVFTDVCCPICYGIDEPRKHGWSRNICFNSKCFVLEYKVAGKWKDTFKESKEIIKDSAKKLKDCIDRKTTNQRPPLVYKIKNVAWPDNCVCDSEYWWQCRCIQGAPAPWDFVDASHGPAEESDNDCSKCHRVFSYDPTSTCTNVYFSFPKIGIWRYCEPASIEACSECHNIGYYKTISNYEYCPHGNVLGTCDICDVEWLAITNCMVPIYSCCPLHPDEPYGACSKCYNIRPINGNEIITFLPEDQEDNQDSQFVTRFDGRKSYIEKRTAPVREFMESIKQVSYVHDQITNAWGCGICGEIGCACNEAAAPENRPTWGIINSVPREMEELECECNICRPNHTKVIWIDGLHYCDICGKLNGSDYFVLPCPCERDASQMLYNVINTRKGTCKHCNGETRNRMIEKGCCSDCWFRRADKPFRKMHNVTDVPKNVCEWCDDYTNDCESVVTKYKILQAACTPSSYFSNDPEWDGGLNGDACETVLYDMDNYYYKCHPFPATIFKDKNKNKV